MNRYMIRALMIAACAATLLATGVCQELTAKSAAEVRGGQHVLSRVPADALAQLSGSLQQLASKVSPAVVQIEVTGFGPAEDRDHKDTALIVRQHTINAGVIVDPDGYIMTNAHVVEGAHRIRVILAVPTTTFFDAAGAGNAPVLDAKIIGSHKRADLALLKVDASNLPITHLINRTRVVSERSLPDSFRIAHHQRGIAGSPLRPDRPIPQSYADVYGKATIETYSTGRAMVSAEYASLRNPSVVSPVYAEGYSSFAAISVERPERPHRDWPISALRRGTS